MLLAGYEFYFFPGQCGDVNTPYEKFCIYCAVGYFCYDFICMAWYGLLDAAMILHHSITIIGMSIALV